MENLVLEKINIVICLKEGPKFTDQQGNLVTLSIRKGETLILNKASTWVKLLIAYAIALWLGETLRSVLFLDGCRKHKMCSGLFVLLKLKLHLSRYEFIPISSQALSSFYTLISFVRTSDSYLLWGSCDSKVNSYYLSHPVLSFTGLNHINTTKLMYLSNEIRVFSPRSYSEKKEGIFFH